MASRGERIWHWRGLRQGDPLSPLLFILVMDVLNRLLGTARDHGLLQPTGHVAVKYPCSLYADDVIIFAAPTTTEAQTIARLVHIFWKATGLKTNLAKCSITPIYGAEEAITQIQRVLPCKVLQSRSSTLGYRYPRDAYQDPSFDHSWTKSLPKCQSGRGP
jgi:hypothetical protein